MTAPNRYGIYPAAFTNGSGTWKLLQMHSFTLSPGANRNSLIVGGALDPAAQFVDFSTPTVDIATNDLNKLLTNVSVSAGFNATQGAIFLLQQRVDGGTFATGSAHDRYTTTKGWCGIQSINATQDQIVEGAMRYWVLYDGTNVPFQRSITASLSGTTPAFNSAFWLGPMYVNGALVPGLKSVRVDPGVNYETLRTAGMTVADCGAIIERRPSITITLPNTAYSATIGSMFLAATGSAVDFYLRAGATGGERQGDDQAVHIKITVAAGSWGPDDISVTGQDDANLTITIMPTGTLSLTLGVTVPAS